MKLSLQPLARMFDSRVRQRAARPLAEVATRRWEIAAAESATVPAAYFLEGQLDRIRAWEFLDEHPGKWLRGGQRVSHGATRAFEVDDAWLLDGVVYCRDAVEHLRPRANRLPRLHAAASFARGAVCCTPGGNRYFGTWLMDDCPLYPLASDEGTPVATDEPMSPHAERYAELLGIHPTPVRGGHFRKLVVFDDMGQNRDKARRFEAMRAKIRAHFPADPHPGVFLLRGSSGVARVLRNERELAEHLRRHRGFRVVDPTQHDVDEVLRRCAGARIVAGIEGSAMIHGIMGLRRGDAIFTVQPPERFVGVYKDIADRDGQHFAFIVGRPESDGEFSVDLDEAERTLDLLPKRP